MKRKIMVGGMHSGAAASAEAETQRGNSKRVEMVIMGL
jgi:hypothetical protein